MQITKEQLNQQTELVANALMEMYPSTNMGYAQLLALLSIAQDLKTLVKLAEWFVPAPAEITKDHD